MHAKRVVKHVVPREMLKVDVELVDTGWVVHVGHNLIALHPILLAYLLAAVRVEGLQHGYVCASQVPQGP